MSFLETHLLQRRIVTYAMLGILLTGIVAGLATAIPYYRQARESLEEAALYGARLRAIAVAQLIDRWAEVTLQITSRTAIRDKLVEYQRGGLDRASLTAYTVPRLADATRLSGDIAAVVRLDRDGAAIAGVGSPIPTALLPDPSGVGRVPRPRGPVAFAGAYHLLMAAAIYSADGERIGTDVVAFRIDPLLVLLHQVIDAAAPGSRAYLAQQEEGVVLEARGDGGGVLHGPVPASLSQGLAKAFGGKTGVLPADQTDPQGEVVVHVPIEGGWGLAVVSRSGSLYAPVVEALSLPALSIGCMLLLGTWGTVRLIRPLSAAVIRSNSELADLAEQQRALLEHARGFVYRYDAAGRLSYLSGNVETITGFTPDQLADGFLDRLTDHPDNAAARLYAEQVRAGGLVPPYTLELCHRSGERIVLEVSERPHRVGGRPAGVVGVARDVTERVRTAEALEASEERLRTVIDATPDIICFKDGQGRWLEANEADLRLFRLTGVDFRGRRDAELADFTDPLYRDAFLACEVTDQRAWDRAVPSRGEEIIPTPDGRTLVFDIVKVPIFGDGGARKGLVVVGRDITERKWVEEELRLAASVFQGSHEGILITDGEQRVVRVNAAGAQSLGASPEEIQGRLLCELLDLTRSQPDFCSQVSSLVQVVGSWQGEAWYRRKDGRAMPSWQHVSGIRDETGRIVRYVLLFTDLSEKKDSEERIRYLADFDPLTGLPNRTYFTVRLGERLAEAERVGGRLGLVFIDLDRFKNVNDSLGHPVGDKLLQEVAIRLARSVREQDLVARLGGDEFTVLLTDLQDARDAGAVAHKILEALGQPVRVDGYEIFVAGSIGISLYPDDGEDARTLIRNADAAMYRAKEKGRNTYQYYTPELTDQSFERLDLEVGLRRALERGELVLQYQPQAAAADGQVLGVEALVRWRHPERGLVSPATFIPLAEDTGLIEPIGEWVLMAACRQAVAWNRAGVGPLRMAVNLSGYQIVYGDVVASVRRALAESGLPAEQLELEITEGFVLQHAEQGISTLNELKALGVTLAIDDFGTGYSSLSYLKRLPIDRLKIDRSFVRDIPDDRDDVAITTTIIGMARHLGLQVIAEGVETAVQLEFLRERGCDELQGYYLSKPLFAADLETFVRQPRGTAPG